MLHDVIGKLSRQQHALTGRHSEVPGLLQDRASAATSGRAARRPSGTDETHLSTVQESKSIVRLACIYLPYGPHCELCGSKGQLAVARFLLLLSHCSLCSSAVMFRYSFSMLAVILPAISPRYLREHRRDRGFLSCTAFPLLQHPVPRDDGGGPQLSSAERFSPFSPVRCDFHHWYGCAWYYCSCGLPESGNCFKTAGQ